MRPLTECPQSNWGTWHFRLFGVPVQVKIWFWLTTLMMCGSTDDASVLIWVAVCFVSILLHELGHVAAYKFFGDTGEVVLYAWGGLAFGSGRWRTAFEQFVVSLAGPFAGFLLTGLTWVVATQTGATVHLGVRMFLPYLTAEPKAVADYTMSTYRWYTVLNDLLWVNFYWGLVNLLPIYPLDGGQAARAVLTQHNWKNGLRQSLLLSAFAAAAMALMALGNRSIYLTLFFGLLAVSSLQSLETVPPHVKPAYRQWR